MIKYKLTDENMRTYGGFQWQLGVREKSSGEGPLCTSGWFHCYDDPILAVLLNPIHANISKPRLFEAEVGGKHKDDRGLKCGFSEMTLLRKIDTPQVSIEQVVKFGILCTKEVYSDEQWNMWADKWLSGEDISRVSAESAAWSATTSAAWSATESAARSAESAARSATESAARSAESAAEAAARSAAWSAESAARSAVEAGKKIDLISIVEKIRDE